MNSLSPLLLVCIAALASAALLLIHFLGKERAKLRLLHKRIRTAGTYQDDVVLYVLFQGGPLDRGGLFINFQQHARGESVIYTDRETGQRSVYQDTGQYDPDNERWIYRHVREELPDSSLRVPLFPYGVTSKAHLENIHCSIHADLSESGFTFTNDARA